MECWLSSKCKVYPYECNPDCLRYLEYKYLLESSNLPVTKYTETLLLPKGDLKAFQKLQAIQKDIRNFTKEGKNLYIYSLNYGNGKTEWSVKLLLAFFASVWAGNGFKRRGIFISVPEFIDRNREAFDVKDEEYLQLRRDLITCDLVVWDDIGAVKLTEYQYSMLFNYIDARICAGKTNIFTSNANKPLLLENVGGRLFSRIWNLSEIIEFVGGDKRGGVTW